MATRATVRSVERAETASETIINNAAEIKHVTDVLGRKIGYAKPSALHRWRLMKILGPENSKNEPLLGHGYIAFLVRSVDGEIVPAINSERQLEAMIARLDDEGMVAVGTAVAEDAGIILDDDTKEVVKN